MTLPNTCRLSSRARPCSNSASGNSLSTIGAMPPTIFDRLSRILRIEAPNEPNILYCCWNNCIKLIVTLGPAVEPQVTSLPPRLRQNNEALKPSPPTCSNTTSTPFLAVSFRHLDGDRADAGTAGMHENSFARLEFGVVEQHVLGGAEGDRRAGGVAQ